MRSRASGREKDNNPSIDEDEARADVVKLHEKVLLPRRKHRQLRRRLQKSPPKRTTAKEKGRLGAAIGAQQKAMVVQEYMKALQKQQEQLAKQQEMLARQYEELAKGASRAPNTFEWNLQRSNELQKKLQGQAAVNVPNGWQKSVRTNSES